MSKTLCCTQTAINAIKESLTLPVKDEVDAFVNIGKVEAMRLVEALSVTDYPNKYFYYLLGNKIRKVEIIYVQYHEALNRTSFICKYENATDEDLLRRFWDFEIGTNIFLTHKEAKANLDDKDYNGDVIWSVDLANANGFKYVAMPHRFDESMRADIGLRLYTSEKRAQQIAQVRNLRKQY